MPEGDNVLRSATVLGRELTGRTLSRIELNDRPPVRELEGQSVRAVEAIGKHLLIHIGNDWTLRVHLGMHGGWVRRHVREGKPPRWTVNLVTDDVAYICKRSYRAEFLRTAALKTHPRLGRLGPDLLKEPPDIDEAVRRALVSGHAQREIGDLLLDQRVAAGIGNIYKSETLFECRIHPRALVGELGPERIELLFRTAARLMRLNLLIRRHRNVPVRRRETPTTQRLWVYMRHGQPCLDCGTPIVRFLQGDHARSTYFCPHCQPEPATRS